MGDVFCKKCGEPWDYYGILHGDMTKEEAKRFFRGEGCPCCGFGKKIRGCEYCKHYVDTYGEPICKKGYVVEDYMDSGCSEFEPVVSEEEATEMFFESIVENLE